MYQDWESIYRDNVGRLYRLMFARVGNRPDAEDLTAEVFKLALPPLRLSASPPENRAYLIATAQTVLANHWRRCFGIEVTVLGPDADVAWYDEPGDERRAPSEVAKILAGLPDRSRRMFASGAAQQTSAQRQLTPDEGTWHDVGERADLLAGVVTRFSTPGAVGFVGTENGTLGAVSGVCSHQGCLLEYNEAARRLDCPCHRAAFSLTGEVLFSQLATPPPPLPRVALRDEGSRVQVYLPKLT